MKKIKLTRGKFAIVDDEDYPYLLRFSWHYILDRSGNGHAGTTIHQKRGASFTLYMEVFLIKNGKMKNGKCMVITHLNRNTLDNRKKNLFLVGAIISAGRHRKKKGKFTSEYKGVSFCRNRWHMCIKSNNIRFDKVFKTEKEAAEAYNKKARELFGKFAYQNVIK